MKEPRAFAMLGYRETNCYMFPDADIVIVRVQSEDGPTPEGEYSQRAWPLFDELCALSAASRKPGPARGR